MINEKGLINSNPEVEEELYLKLKGQQDGKQSQQS